MSEGDFEIVYRPIKQIIIFQTLELPIEEFFKRIGLIARTGEPVGLSWAEGIVFLAVPFQPDSETITEEALEGKMYWSSVIFASMPKYEPLRKIGGIEIPIIDQTSDPYQSKVARWVKERKG